MQKRGLSQEGLKLIACIAMLLDHIGAVIVMAYFENATGENKVMFLELYEMLRMIGRLAFPIYCFLLVEGFCHTHNPKRYALRLLGSVFLAEIPYDLAIYGKITWQHQSVMITLLLGFLMLMAMEKNSKLWWKLLVVIPFALLAGVANSDYGAKGIFVVALFALTRGHKWDRILQIFGLWCIFAPFYIVTPLSWLQTGFAITIQELAALAIVPISLYDGRKATKSKVVQSVFYLFYPAHLLVLYLLK